MNDVNWLKIKLEYETTSISQRKLSDKYSVSYNTLKDKANREKWAKSKIETHIKITSKARQKTIDKISKEESNRNLKHLQSWDKLLNEVENRVDRNCDIESIVKLATAMEKIQKGQRLAEGLDKQSEQSNANQLDDLIKVMSMGGAKRRD